MGEHLDKNIYPLEWDSNFFGLSVGKLIYRDSSDCENLKRLRVWKGLPNLLYVFSDQDLSCCLPDLVAIDQKLVFAHDLPSDFLSDTESVGGIHLYNPAIDSYEQLLELALLSGTYSRFRLDENISLNDYERLYTRWLDKSIEESEILVLVVRSGHNVAGFITVELPTSSVGEAQIGLVAVSPKYQRQGIAKTLLRAAVDYASAAEQKTLLVATQAVNTAAVNLYSRNGFELISRTWIYHLWNS